MKKILIFDHVNDNKSIAKTQKEILEADVVGVVDDDGKTITITKSRESDMCYERFSIGEFGRLAAIGEI